MVCPNLVHVSVTLFRFSEMEAEASRQKQAAEELEASLQARIHRYLLWLSVVYGQPIHHVCRLETQVHRMPFIDVMCHELN